VNTTDRPYRYRRHLLAAFGAAWPVIGVLGFRSGSWPATPSTGIEKLIHIGLCTGATLFAFWIGAYRLHIWRNARNFYGPAQRLLLGHENLTLSAADLCFFIWSVLASMAIVDAVMTRYWETAWLAMIFGVPFIGLFVGATLRLRAEQRERWQRDNHCAHCGYDLTANATGRCPECGATAPDTTTPGNPARDHE
jgi:hypothetical protein